MMAPMTVRVIAEVRISEDRLATLKTVPLAVKPDEAQPALGCPNHEDGGNLKTVAKASEGDVVLERQMLNKIEQRLDQKLSKELSDKADRCRRDNEARGLAPYAKVLGTPTEIASKYSQLKEYAKKGLGIGLTAAIIEGVKKLMGGG